MLQRLIMSQHICTMGQKSSGLDSQQISELKAMILPSLPPPALVHCISSLNRTSTIGKCTRHRGQVCIWIYRGGTARRKMRHSRRSKMSGEL